MASKKESSQPQRVNLTEDATVRAFQFIRSWARNGQAITNGQGKPIQSASPIMRGGAWGEDYTLAQLNKDIAEDKVTPFVNSNVIVYRINPNPRVRSANALATA